MSNKIDLSGGRNRIQPHEITAEKDSLKPYARSYANTATREGATGLIAADVGILALQEDTNQLWLLVNHSPVTWQEIGSGGGGGTIPQSSMRVFVDVENGTDSPTTTGQIDDPYQTLAYACTQQPLPTSLGEYGTEILFMLEPGTYVGDVTLPYRSGVSIDGEVVTIEGNIYWYQDPAYMFEYPAWPTSLYGKAALKIGTGSSNPMRIVGNVVSQNVNPSADASAIGTKYFIAERVVFDGGLHNLASGGPLATGPLQTIFDLCQFVDATAAIFGGHEALGFGANEIRLQSRNSYILARICGNIWMEHLVSCGILYINYAEDLTGAAYEGNIGGVHPLASPGSLGLRDCTVLPAFTYTLAFGKDPANVYDIYSVLMDASSYEHLVVFAAATFSNFDFGSLTPFLVDDAGGVRADTSGYVGNLAGVDPNVKACLDILDTLPTGGGGTDALIQQVWVDEVNGDDVTADGSRALPYATLSAATTDFHLSAYPTLIFEIMPGTYGPTPLTPLTVPVGTVYGHKCIFRTHGNAQLQYNFIREHIGSIEARDVYFVGTGATAGFPLVTGVGSAIGLRISGYVELRAESPTSGLLGVLLFKNCIVMGGVRCALPPVPGVYDNYVFCEDSYVHGAIGGEYAVDPEGVPFPEADTPAHRVFLYATRSILGAITGVTTFGLDSCKLGGDVSYLTSPWNYGLGGSVYPQYLINTMWIFPGVHDFLIGAPFNHYAGLTNMDYIAFKNLITQPANASDITSDTVFPGYSAAPLRVSNLPQATYCNVSPYAGGDVLDTQGVLIAIDNDDPDLPAVIELPVCAATEGGAGRRVEVLLPPVSPRSDIQAAPFLVPETLVGSPYVNAIPTTGSPFDGNKVYTLNQTALGWKELSRSEPRVVLRASTEGGKSDDADFVDSNLVQYFVLGPNVVEHNSWRLDAKFYFQDITAGKSFNGTSEPVGIGDEEIYVCTTTGGGYVQGHLYKDVEVGVPYSLIIPMSQIVTVVAGLYGGAVDFPPGSYLYHSEAPGTLYPHPIPRMTVLGQIDGTSPSSPPSAGRVYVCTTAGGTYVQGELYESDGSAWVALGVGTGWCLRTGADLTGGAITFSADHLYVASTYEGPIVWADWGELPIVKAWEVESILATTDHPNRVIKEVSPAVITVLAQTHAVGSGIGSDLWDIEYVVNQPYETPPAFWAFSFRALGDGILPYVRWTAYLQRRR